MHSQLIICNNYMHLITSDFYLFAEVGVVDLSLFLGERRNISKPCLDFDIVLIIIVALLENTTIEYL